MSSQRYFHIYSYLLYSNSLLLIPKSVSQGHHKNLPQLNDLTEQKCYVSWFWRREVQNLGVDMLHVLQRLYGKFHFLLLSATGDCRCSLACGHIIAICVSMVSLQPPPLCVFSSVYLFLFLIRIYVKALRGPPRQSMITSSSKDPWPYFWPYHIFCTCKVIFISKS